MNVDYQDSACSWTFTDHFGIVWSITGNGSGTWTLTIRSSTSVLIWQGVKSGPLSTIIGSSPEGIYTRTGGADLTSTRSVTVPCTQCPTNTSPCCGQYEVVVSGTGTALDGQWTLIRYDVQPFWSSSNGGMTPAGSSGHIQLFCDGTHWVLQLIGSGICNFKFTSPIFDCPSRFGWTRVSSTCSSVTLVISTKTCESASSAESGIGESAPTSERDFSSQSSLSSNSSSSIIEASLSSSSSFTHSSASSESTEIIYPTSSISSNFDPCYTFTWQLPLTGEPFIWIDPTSGDPEDTTFVRFSPTVSYNMSNPDIVGVSFGSDCALDDILIMISGDDTVVQTYGGVEGDPATFTVPSNAIYFYDTEGWYCNEAYGPFNASCQKTITDGVNTHVIPQGTPANNGTGHNFDLAAAGFNVRSFSSGVSRADLELFGFLIDNILYVKFAHIVSGIGLVSLTMRCDNPFLESISSAPEPSILSSLSTENDDCKVECSDCCRQYVFYVSGAGPLSGVYIFDQQEETCEWIDTNNPSNILSQQHGEWIVSISPDDHSESDNLIVFKANNCTACPPSNAVAWRLVSTTTGGTPSLGVVALLCNTYSCDQCIQLGSHGSFAAENSGTLQLYFNDYIGYFSDNTGSYSVSITDAGDETIVWSGTVNPILDTGTTGPLVVAGHTYGVVASGTVNYASSGDCVFTPDGTTSAHDCAPPGGPSPQTVCPSLTPWSLVGKIICDEPISSSSVGDITCPNDFSWTTGSVNETCSSASMYTSPSVSIPITSGGAITVTGSLDDILVMIDASDNVYSSYDSGTSTVTYTLPYNYLLFNSTSGSFNGSTCWSNKIITDGTNTFTLTNPSSYDTTSALNSAGFSSISFGSNVNYSVVNGFGWITDGHITVKFVYICSGSGSATVSGINCFEVNCSPSLHLPFDEGSGTTTTDTVISESLTIPSGVTWIAGEFGPHALTFSGTSGLNGSDATLPMGTQDRTVSCWFRTSTDAEMTLIEYGNAGNNNEAVILCQYVSGSVLCVSQYGQSVHGGPSIADGNWHMGTTTYDGTNWYVYLDAVQVASGSMTTATSPGPSSGANSLTIGKGDGGYWTGDIDDVRVYACALTLSEIQALYVATCSPLLHFPFDEGTGTTTTDTQISEVLTIPTGVTWATGIVGPHCLSFNGTAGLSGSDATLPINYPNVTITLWFNTTNSANCTLIQYGDMADWTGGGSGLMITLGGGTISMTGGSQAPMSGSIGGKDDGQWHFLAVQINPSVQNIWIDGILDISNSYLTLDITLSSLQIGQGNATTQPGITYYTGKIEDIRIYPCFIPTQDLQTQFLSNCSPVLHFPFDEGAGTTTTDTVSSVVLTIPSGVTWAPGAVGPNCLSFNGTAALSGSDAGLPSGADVSVTVTFWVKTTDSSNGIMFQYGKASTGNGLTITTYDSGELNLSNGTGGFVAGSVDDGNWHFVAATYLAGGSFLYLDGANIGSGGAPTVILDSLLIGTGNSVSDLGGTYFTGDIDDVTIYPCALTAGQIAFLYAVPCTCPDEVDLPALNTEYTLTFTGGSSPVILSGGCEDVWAGTDGDGNSWVLSLNYASPPCVWILAFTSADESTSFGMNKPFGSTPAGPYPNGSGGAFSFTNVRLS